MQQMLTSNNIRLVLGYNYCVVPEKNRYPPHGRSLEIPRGEGGLKSQILEANYEAKLESLETGVQNRKTFRGGNKDIFWYYTLHM